MKKVIFWIVFIILIALGGFIYFKFYFPVTSDAVKAGELNYVMYKGYIWKTYEGKLIQAGFHTKAATPGVQSNEFDFSVVDEQLAQELMSLSGHTVALRYKQYNGYLPWRGMQRNIVFAIEHVDQTPVPSESPLEAISAMPAQ